MKITPLTDHIGALIEDIQLNNITDHQFDCLYQAFLKHKVIFLRDQILTAQQHLTLATRFGALEPAHPFFTHVKEFDQVTIIESASGNPPGESFWHTDMTWQETPPKCSILHAQFVPKIGGDTIWCNMAQAWNTLPESEKQYLRTLKVSHELHAFKGSRYDKEELDDQNYADKVAQKYPPVIRNMVQIHEETQEEVLYINEQFTRGVVGLEKTQSDGLLTKLFARAREPQLQIRFSWQANSIAIWDNRATQHFAVTDYGDSPRRLHRVTVKGESQQSTVKRHNKQG